MAIEPLNASVKRSVLIVINSTTELCARRKLKKTAVTQIAGQHNKHLTCRLLMDCGSMRSYITNRLAKDLEIKKDKEVDLIVYTFGSNKPYTIKSSSAEVTVLTKRQIEKKIKVNIVPHITDHVPVVKIDHPKIDITADDESVGQRVDLLIGNDLYFSFLRKDLLKIKDDLYLIDSDFGWLTGGFDKAFNNNNEDVLSVVTYCSCHDANCPYFSEPDLPLRNIDIKFLWALESIGITDSPKTTKEEEAVHHFNENVKYCEGRYQVKWPWVQYPPELPTNYGLALGRLKSLLKRSDEETLDNYKEILKEQLEANVIEIVQPSPFHEITHPIHFLPHHIVKQKGKRGRIVYDASSKIKNEKSLNECLYGGPSMLEDLTGLIFNFRTGKIGITADVERAFLQVGLQTEDRDVTRFLWVKDPSKEVTDDNIVQYRFCRVPFGIISSPFLLTATIRHHISKTENSLLSKIADRCYVDNLVTSADSNKEALQLYKDTNRVFHELGMNIRDWMSNDKSFVGEIPLSQREKRTDKMKILGLLWDIKNDTLQLNIDPEVFINESRGITKKGVLKVLARLYDPCGFASPLILPGKLIFQELCKRKLKWEDILPEDMQMLWENIVRNLAAIRDVKVPRYVGDTCEQTEEIVQYELHGFTDASMNSYAAIVYLRLIGKNKTAVTFLMSKTKITPIEDKNDLKIPRLELLSFLIGSRLLKYIHDHIDINLSKLYLWSDSQVVLAWMKTSKLLPPFVARRVNEIKQTSRTLGIELRYVDTKNNPADIATRPELWHKKRELWFYGPKFLTQEGKHWPSDTQINKEICLVGRALDMVDGPEMTSKGYENEELALTTEEQELTEQLREESSNVDRTSGNDVTTDNIKRIQKEYFPNEVMGKKTNLSLDLGIFRDIDGVLRSKGRFGQANLPYDKKYPIVIPKQSSLATQIIKRTHEENYHVGVPHTLSIIREKYWIPQGRAQVQKVIRSCPQCVKYGGGPFQLPPAPELPSARVNYSSPFHFTGIDYLGPVLVDTEKGKEKRWICLLTCLAVRALHLELVKDLSAKECLLAIRRFTAIRGIPDTITSDNALQFKLTSEVLSSDYCVKKGIKWKFIAQLAPWQGGFYERLVALVKHCLKRTLDKHLLTDTQMTTVLKEVESVLNTRPLTAVGAEPEEVLKPADFLTLGQCLDFDTDLQTSNQQLTNTKVDLVQSWKRGQMILEEYKRMFINQYLPSLRERSFHTHKQPRIKSKKVPEIGNIVQIRDDSKNRTNWKVGKIVSLIKGQDGVVRVARVKVNDTELTRSLGHLYPLEADDVEETCIPDKELVDQEENRVVRVENTLDYRNVNEVPQVPVSDTGSLNLPMDQVIDNTNPQTVPSDEPLSLQENSPTPVEETCPPPTDLVEGSVNESSSRNEKRDAAIKAKEKIAEWTRHLLTVL
ncbi:uncharacterized protein LOC134741297 [Cydia strobilella]|uniref:uncharacterized protein LOC134741297 n=1 Tax=Cydia strobilella TaxID=1100964 RepID=UPI0030046B71